MIRSLPQNGVLALQSVLTPTLLNEFKLGYNSALSRINGVAPTFNGIDFSKLSLNIAGSVAGFALPGQGANAGVATPGGLVRANSATNGSGQPYTPYTLSFIDNLSWTHGNHSFKFGGEVREIRMWTDRIGGTTYTWASINNFLTNSLQSTQFLGDLSAPSPFFNNSTGQAQARQTYYIGYAQDEWKIKPNLTLNYGLRYEYYTPLREKDNRQILFDIVTGVLRDPSGDPYSSSKTNFGPRIAMTWSPNPNGNGFFGGGKTVLRGGFGIYYGPGQTEDQIQPIDRTVSARRSAAAVFRRIRTQSSRTSSAIQTIDRSSRALTRLTTRFRKRFISTRVGATGAAGSRRANDCLRRIARAQPVSAQRGEPHSARTDNNCGWHDATDFIRHRESHERFRTSDRGEYDS